MQFGLRLPQVWCSILAATPALDEGNAIVNWALWYLITMTLELPMVLLAWRLRGCPGRLRPWLLASLAGNLLSHPLAVYLGTNARLEGGGATAVTAYLLIETGAIMIETWAFRFLAARFWTDAALMSLAANAVTAVLGAYLLFRA